ILNYYQDKWQFHHQTLTVLYLYTSMRLESMFRLRWRDVYDFNNKTFYPRYNPNIARNGFELSPPIARALTTYMNAANSQPGEPILKSGDAGVIGFSFQVIREAMECVWRCRAAEPYSIRQAFKNTGMYRRATGFRTAPAQPLRPYLIPLNGSLSNFQWNRDYESSVTKRDLVRLLNDCLEKRQYQSHMILALYLYSDIPIMDMTQIRWRDVYNFRKEIFYSRIIPANIPLNREATRALLAYLAQHPERQPDDFILTSQGEPMDPNTVYRRIREVMGRLTDMRLVRFGQLYAWIHQTLAARPPRRVTPQRPYDPKIAARKCTRSGLGEE
ncbi:MAG: hypothetical protein LBL26_05015, partial [Peptococcaceae bacterium]|nr:hypothetical protein [Peptococcaceae bacterium]